MEIVKMRGTTEMNYEKGQFLLLPWSVLRNRSKELIPPLVASIMAKFEQIMERFGNILKQSFKGHKNIE